MAASKQQSTRSKTTQQHADTSIEGSSKRSVKAKTVNVSKDGVATFSQGSAIADEERRQMIAEAAYFRYQERGYEAGYDVDDWLDAEREIDRLLDF